MNDLTKGVALFLGGAMVGAAVAMLLTPKTGAEMREQIANMASEAKDRAESCREQINKGVEVVKGVIAENEAKA